jgi:hypothetical protein
MTAVTLKQTEATPDAYPDLGSPSPLSTAAAALDPAIYWKRIESYCAWRWTERSIEWLVEGPGEWSPPLSPSTIATVEIWTNGAWAETFDVAASPCGFLLPGDGPYRFTGTIGGGSPEPECPPIVLEAARRLAEYLASPPGRPGASSERVTIGDVLQRSISRSPSWLASAIQNSGAADLLRSYRRAG